MDGIELIEEYEIQGPDQNTGYDGLFVECGGYEIYTSIAHESDCEYGIGFCCEECVCCGGYKDPRYDLSDEVEAFEAVRVAVSRAENAEEKNVELEHILAELEQKYSDARKEIHNLRNDMQAEYGRGYADGLAGCVNKAKNKSEEYSECIPLSPTDCLTCKTRCGGD